MLALLIATATACSCRYPPFYVGIPGSGWRTPDVEGARASTWARDGVPSLPANARIVVTAGIGRRFGVSLRERSLFLRARLVPAAGAPVRLRAGPPLDHRGRQRAYAPARALRPDESYRLEVLAEGRRWVGEVRTVAADVDAPQGELVGPAGYFVGSHGLGDCRTAGPVVHLWADGEGEAVFWAVWLPGRLDPDLDGPPDALELGDTGSLTIGSLHQCGPDLVSPSLRDGMRVGVQPVDAAGNRGAKQVIELAPFGWLDAARTVPAGASTPYVRQWLTTIREREDWPALVRDAASREASWARTRADSLGLRPGIAALDPRRLALRWLLALAEEGMLAGHGDLARELAWPIVAAWGGHAWVDAALDEHAEGVRDQVASVIAAAARR